MSPTPTPQTTAPATSPRPDFGHALRTASFNLSRTDAGHFAGNGAADSQFAEDSHHRYEVRPRGNAVSHEDEMLKLAAIRWTTTP
jgi:flagellar basal body rod protein FlgB